MDIESCVADTRCHWGPTEVAECSQQAATKGQNNTDGDDHNDGDDWEDYDDGDHF